MDVALGMLKSKYKEPIKIITWRNRRGRAISQACFVKCFAQIQLNFLWTTLSSRRSERAQIKKREIIKHHLPA